MSLIGSKTKELWKNSKYRKHMSDSHKGQIPWNKGKKMTEEHNNKLKGSHGYIHPEESKRFKRGRYIGFHYKNKQWYEHVYVYLRDNDCGLYTIPKGWDVHHINNKPKDNRIENLVCIPRSVHSKIHHPKYWGINKGRGD